MIFPLIGVRLHGWLDDLRAKLTERLAADSGKLDVLGKKLIEVNLKINENQVRFGESIRAIKLLQPIAAE